MTIVSDKAEAVEDAVLVDRRGHVLVVTMNRPRARNAVNNALWLGVGEALDEAESDPDIWVVVITGAGELSFCAGADLKEAATGQLGKGDPRLSQWGFAGYVAHHISKPTIAAVNGFALGGGTEIVLASDLAVASETATFGLPEVKRGLVAAAGGTFRLPRQIPEKVAMEAILTGEPLSAERALQLGLVNRVVPASDVLSEALALAESICANAPLAVQSSKRIARGITDGGVESERADWTRIDVETKALMSSDDSREGMRAFAEKRAPKWTGK